MKSRVRVLNVPTANETSITNLDQRNIVPKRKCGHVVEFRHVFNGRSDGTNHDQQAEPTPRQNLDGLDGSLGSLGIVGKIAVGFLGLYARSDYNPLLLFEPNNIRFHYSATGRALKDSRVVKALVEKVCNLVKLHCPWSLYSSLVGPQTAIHRRSSLSSGIVPGRSDRISLSEAPNSGVNRSKVALETAESIVDAL